MGVTFDWSPYEAIPETAVDDPQIDTDLFISLHMYCL